MSQYDPLIFGRSQLERVVSIEPLEDKAEVFFENADGSIESKFIDNDYWILAQNKLDRDFKPLKGNLHYKWGKLYKSREKFFIGRNIYKKQDVYSIYNPQESLMVRRGLTYFKGLKIGDVSVFSFDLETTGLNGKASDAKILLISYTFRDVNTIEKGLICYDEYSSQAEMINAFNETVQRLNPSILCGHNIFGYDLPYLKDVAETNGAELLLGRDGSALKFNSYESKFRKEASQFINYHSCRAYGREIIDTMFLSIRFDVAARKYTSYALKNIIKQEGLEKEGRTFYDASQIRYNYTNPEEWKKIKDYCRDDADDALALYDRMGSVSFYMAQVVPKTFQAIIESATGSQLNSVMVRSYLQEGHSIPKGDEKEAYEGAISFANPGVYKNMLKIDFAALYPSIMRQYKVYDKQKDPNANFLNIVEYFAEYRNKYKKLYKETNIKYYDDLQNMAKVVANSCYGFLGAPGLNFNSPHSAAFITSQARELLKFTIKWATGKEIDEVRQDV